MLLLYTVPDEEDFNLSQGDFFTRTLEVIYLWTCTSNYYELLILHIHI